MMRHVQDRARWKQLVETAIYAPTLQGHAREDDDDDDDGYLADFWLVTSDRLFVATDRLPSRYWETPNLRYNTLYTN